MSQPRRDMSELDDGPSLIELDLSVPETDSPPPEEEEGDFVPFSPSDHGSTVGLGFGRGSLLQTSGLYSSRSTSMNIVGTPGAGAIPMATSLPYSSVLGGGGMSLGSTPVPLMPTMPAGAGGNIAAEIKGNGAPSPVSSNRSPGALPPLRGDASYQILPDDRERANVRRGMKSMSIEIRAIAPYWFKLVKKNAQEAATNATDSSAPQHSCCTRLLSWSLLQRVSQHRVYVFFLLFSVVWFSLMESTEDLVVDLEWGWLLLFSWFIPFTFIAYLVESARIQRKLLWGLLTAFEFYYLLGNVLADGVITIMTLDRSANLWFKIALRGYAVSLLLYALLLDAITTFSPWIKTSFLFLHCANIVRILLLAHFRPASELDNKEVCVIYCINTSFFRSTCLANMLLFMLKYAFLTFRDPRAFVILQQRLRYTPRKETLASLAIDAAQGFTPKAGTGFHAYQPPRPRTASISSNDPSAHRTWNRTASSSEEL